MVTRSLRLLAGVPASGFCPAQAADRRAGTGQLWLQRPGLPAGFWGGGSSRDQKIVAVMGRTGPAGRKCAGPHSQPGVSCPPRALHPWALDPSAVAVEREHALSASASLVARAGSDLPTRRSAGRAGSRLGCRNSPVCLSGPNSLFCPCITLPRPVPLILYHCVCKMWERGEGALAAWRIWGGMLASWRIQGMSAS